MFFGVSIKNIFSGLFVIITIFYCSFFLYKPGFIGYANNFDFIRQSSCVGLWSYIPEHSKIAGHPSYPSSNILYDADISMDKCINSSDNISSYFLAYLLTKGDVVSFVNLGSIKIILILLLSTLAILVSKSKLVSSVILLSILTEGIYLAYANTFYAEFSVISAYTLIVISTYSFIYCNGKYAGFQIAIIFFGIIWLGLSKQQWSYLPVFLMFFYLLVVYRRTVFKKSVIAFLGLSLISVVFFQFMNKHNFESETSISSANKINTVFHAVLPESAEKTQALKVLGLPEHCAANIGINWYHPKQNALNSCPEIKEFSRVKLIYLFAREPATFFVPIVKFTKEMRLFYPDYLGVTIPGEADAFIKLQRVISFSISHALSKIDYSVFFSIVLVFFIGSCLIGFVLILFSKILSLELVSYMYLFTIGGLTVGYSICSSVFGDGYYEAAKHSVLFLGGFYLQLIAFFSIIFYSIFFFLRNYNPDKY